MDEPCRRHFPAGDSNELSRKGIKQCKLENKWFAWTISSRGHSQRVRQLNSGGGGRNRPLVANIGNLGAADIALHEIIEGKMGFDMPNVVELTRPTGKNRRRPQHWTRS